MCCVRPGVFEAKASFFWLQRRLIAVDLPALGRTAKAIAGTADSGRSRRSLTVVKKRACQSRDMRRRKNRSRGGKCHEAIVQYEVITHRSAANPMRRADGR